MSKLDDLERQCNLTDKEQLRGVIVIVNEIVTSDEGETGIISYAGSHIYRFDAEPEADKIASMIGELPGIIHGPDKCKC